MKNFLWISCCGALLWLGSTLYGGETVLKFADDINVFKADEEADFTAAADSELTITDNQGNAVVSRSDAAGRVKTGPLPPGYYRVSYGEGVIGSFVVVPAAYQNDENSALAVDFAVSTSGDLPESREERLRLFEKNARLAELAGVRTIRERINSAGVKKGADGFSYSNFNTTNMARIAGEHGLQVTAVFQNMPRELGRDRDSLKTPANLRDSYNIVSAMADALGPFVDNWEIYNEIDLRNFYQGSACEYAAFMKVASLAIQRHDPGSRVLLSSFATAAPEFRRLLTLSGCEEYYNLNNLHSYSQGEALSSYFRNYTGKLDGGAWATEIGMHLPGTVNRGQEIPEEVSKKAAETIGTLYSEALAGGVLKAYFFLWRYYPSLVSILDMGFNATERYAALATANWLLGNAKYRSTQDIDGVRTHLFDTGSGSQTLVLTAGSKGTARVRVAGEYALHGATGEVISRGEGNGEPIEVAAGQDTRYLCAKSIQVDGGATVSAREEKSELHSPAAILSVTVDGKVPYNHTTAFYELKPGETISGKVRIESFSDERVHYQLKAALAEGGWKYEFTGENASVPGNTGKNFNFTVTAPAETDRGTQRATLVFTTPGLAPAAVNFAIAARELEPVEVVPAFRDFGELRWHPGGYNRQIMKAAISGNNFKVDFTAPGVRMFWPYIDAPKGKAFDWSGYAGLRITLDVKSIRPGTWFMATLTEPQGTRYNSARIMVESPGKHVLLLLFNEFVYFDSVPDEPLFTLDTDRIIRFGLGFHTLQKFKENFQENYTVEYDVVSIEAVKYPVDAE